MNRYDVGKLNEARFEPGSRGRVMKNLLGIRHVREMNMVEAEMLAEATDWAIRHYSAEQRFSVEDGACTVNGLGKSIHGPANTVR